MAEPSFSHILPQEFTDVRRWHIKGTLSISHKSAGYLVFGIMILVMLYNVTSLFGLGIVGIILGVIVCALLLFISSFPKPEEDYLRGGGLTLDVILLRVIIRKLNRVIYIKGYPGKKKTTLGSLFGSFKVTI